MNKIVLKGVIDNIEYSHSINSIDFYKATLTTEENDILSICFKYSSPYTDGDNVELTGSIRSFTEKIEDTKSKVNIYVFTYFDLPENEETNLVNYFALDGRICKKDKLRITKDGRKRMHITLANNIFSANNSQKLNNYIPIVAYDELAEELAKLKISDKIFTEGILHSRKYIKNNNGEVEEKVAYEGVLSYFTMV